MAIKIVSTYKKNEFRYESPDGDIWIIYYVENESRKYVQIGKEGQSENDFVVWDAALLLDIADSVRSISGQAKSNAAPRLKMPSVADHRMKKSDFIEKEVRETMGNFDDSVAPRESFATNQEWFGTRTGVDLSSVPPVGETPEDIKPWAKPRPNLTPPPAAKIKRVGASDMI